MAWQAILGTALNIGGGILASKKGDEQQARSLAIQEQQVALLTEKMNNFKRFVADLPGETAEFLTQMRDGYAEINAKLEQAKAEGDAQRAAVYQGMRDLSEAHMNAELEAIDINKEQFIEEIRGFSDESVKLIQADADANDKLKADYKEESDKVVGNLRKLADASGNRIDSIIKSGLAPEAAATLSKLREGAAAITRNVKNIEAAKGGGKDSRITAAEFEEIKTIGTAIAGLRDQALNDLTSSGGVQLALQQSAGERAEVLKETRGRETLAARSPFIEAELGAGDQAGARSLNTLSSANVESRRLTQAEGEGDLAAQQTLANAQTGLKREQLGQEIGLGQREQDLKFSGMSQEAKTATSVSDIMSAQAQNYFNLGQQSQKRAGGLFKEGIKEGLDGGGFDAIGGLFNKARKFDFQTFFNPSRNDYGVPF